MSEPEADVRIDDIIHPSFSKSFPSPIICLSAAVWDWVNVIAGGLSVVQLELSNNIATEPQRHRV
ncbi:MAG: hypothetical protein IPQ05_10045 [Leptospiraceae bacterium]|nr:hypothetical protein [Leptospiraceae bacterium]